MEIIIRRKAIRTLEAIAEYVEELNTAGAGDRWLDKFFNRASLHSPGIMFNMPCAATKNFHQKDIAASIIKAG